MGERMNRRVSSMRDVTASLAAGCVAGTARTIRAARQATKASANRKLQHASIGAGGPVNNHVQTYP